MRGEDVLLCSWLWFAAQDSASFACARRAIFLDQNHQICLAIVLWYLDRGARECPIIKHKVLQHLCVCSQEYYVPTCHAVSQFILHGLILDTVYTNHQMSRLGAVTVFSPNGPSLSMTADKAADLFDRSGDKVTCSGRPIHRSGRQSPVGSGAYSRCSRNAFDDFDRSFQRSVKP